MVEMTEVANILRNGTKKSLIILDEIGRGTSTFDGLSIAWAVVEYIVNSKTIGAKTLFATHYHELTELEGKIEGVQNYCVSVKEQGDDIIFLRKIIPGGANNSYGIQVAKLAGVPTPVVERAKMILKELDQADITKHAENIKVMEKPIVENHSIQLNLFESEADIVIGELKAMDVNGLTPLEALNKLADIINRLK
jgi:DNA mismatch repair protein MutS